VLEECDHKRTATRLTSENRRPF